MSIAPANPIGNTARRSHAGEAMYNKKSVHFVNYWLESTEANLKFFRASRRFLPDNTRVYSPINTWLYCGKIIDKVANRRVGISEFPFLHSAAKVRLFLMNVFDLHSFLSSSPLCKHPRKSASEIEFEQQQCLKQIRQTLNRIKARARARCEDAGIKYNGQKIVLTDEEVKVALRAALKNRK